MAVTNPELVRDTGFYGERIVLADRRTFPTKLWLPTLMEIKTASTIGEQHTAMSKAILNVVGSDAGFTPIANNKMRYERGSYFEARFRHNPDDGTARLSFVGARSEGRVGYQTPDEEQPKPAFAVIDVGADDYHRVVRNPDEQLLRVENDLGYRVLRGLAYNLDSRYPGAELIAQIKEQIPEFPH